MGKKTTPRVITKKKNGRVTSGGLTARAGKVKKWESWGLSKNRNVPVRVISPPTTDTQRYAPHAVRMRVLRRDGYECRYCGVKVTNETANMDHVIPWRDGGKSVERNLVTACQPCNKKKLNEHWQPETLTAKRRRKRRASPKPKRSQEPLPVPEYISEQFTLIEETPKNKSRYSCNVCSEELIQKKLGRHLTQNHL